MSLLTLAADFRAIRYVQIASPQGKSEINALTNTEWPANAMNNQVLTYARVIIPLVLHVLFSSTLHSQRVGGLSDFTCWGCC